jgi:tight adherence protein B
MLVLAGMAFLVTLGLSVSGFYFLVKRPAARKRLRNRLTSIRQSLGPAKPNGLILRDDALSDIPTLNRILQRLPPVVKLQMALAQAGMATPIGTLLTVCVSLGLLALFAGLLLRMPARSAAGGRSHFRSARGGVHQAPAPLRALRGAVPGRDRPAGARGPGRTRVHHGFRAHRERDPGSSGERVPHRLRPAEPGNAAARRSRTSSSAFCPTCFFVSFEIQRESGGNLAEILDKLSYVIRERFKILRQVQVFTAEARMSLYILTAVPPVTAILMFFANREYISTLFNTPIKQKMLAIGIVLQMTKYFVMKQITRLKI